MNERFYHLPAEKQERIIQAWYRVFAQNPYKKSPMREIADAAGISKSLLFHYFQNKRELYLFLWEQSAQFTMEWMERYGCYEQNDLFEMMYRGMQAKMQIFRQYPDMGYFAVRAFYEKDVAVCQEVQKIYQKMFGIKARETIQGLDQGQFVPGLDLKMMYREMYWASEGYLWEALQREELDVQEMEKDFLELLKFWKAVYLRRG